MLSIFKKKARIVHKFKDGMIITDYLEGRRRSVNADIQTYKSRCKSWFSPERNVIICWW